MRTPRLPHRDVLEGKVYRFLKAFRDRNTTITLPPIMCFLCIEANEGIVNRELTALTGVPTMTVFTAVKLLIDLNMVESYPDERHAQALRYRLTEAGKRWKAALEADLES
jgi:DNA-binding MarR family transcriptional regulator